MNLIKIEIKKKEVIIMNNGKSLPIKKHQKEKMYIAELVFGNLLTGSNFDDNDKKVTGGRNGIGAKITNIFSKLFRVETVSNNKKLEIEWKNNMDWKSEPSISSV